MYFRTDENVRACDDVRTELMPFIQSQYAASIRITALLQSAKDHILPDADIAQFYDLMFNVETAQGYGLDVWGNIVGVTRRIPSHADPSITITLDDDMYRTLIMHKAAANIMDSSLYSMNYLLKRLYPDYTCYIQLASNFQTDDDRTYDANPMEINYVFINTRLTDVERSIFDYIGDYNRGAGVGWNLFEFIQDNIFGFYGSELNNFGTYSTDPEFDGAGGVFFIPSGGA